MRSRALALLVAGALAVLGAGPALADTPSMSAAPAASSRAEPSPAGQAVRGSDAPRSAARIVPRRPPPAPAWLTVVAQASRVTVRAPAGLERLATRLAKTAEAALARAATDLDGLPAPEHIEVRLVEQASELADVAPLGRGAPAYAVGVAYPDVGVVSIARRRGAEVQDAEGTLRHELAHVALGVALGPDVPRWLHEGFAYQHSAEWSMERAEILAGMVWFGSLTPLEQLDASFPAEEHATHRAYVQSYDFVGFLSRRGRWADNEDDGDRYAFRRFLAGLAEGRSLDDAARLAYGRTLPNLYAEWRDDLTNRLMLLPIGVFTFALWLVATLLLVLAWRRRRRQRRATLERWAQEEAQRAASFPLGDPHPTVVAFEAARAEMEHEERAAQAAARRELAADDGVGGGGGDRDDGSDRDDHGDGDGDRDGERPRAAPPRGDTGPDRWLN